MGKSRTKEKDQIVVVCPVKNDNEYLMEYTDHYLNLGFDKVIFLDNNDDQSIRPSEVLEQYVKNGNATLLDCRNTDFNDNHFKHAFYCNYDFNWVFFADDDEFLELKKHQSIRDFLNSFKPDVSKIVFNNMHYGDNGHIYQKPGKVQERFPDPLPVDLSIPGAIDLIYHNSAIKSILKKRKSGFFQITSHCMIDDKPFYNADKEEVKLEPCMWRVSNNNITYETAYVSHYCTKSLEEFVKTKMKRSQTNCSKYKNRFQLENYYFMFNANQGLKYQIDERSGDSSKDMQKQSLC
jgi:hypothetical protein